jgi:uncharacterized phage protein gp47/JayE
MAFSRPSLPQLVSRAAADLGAALAGVDAMLRRANVAVLARLHAAAVSGLYGYLDWIYRQAWPDSADEEHLRRHAAIWLATPQLPATAASGPAVFRGLAGASLPAGTLWRRADGVQYSLRAEVTVSPAGVVGLVDALEPGVGGDADPGTALTLVTPVAGVNSTAVVDSAGLTGGAEAESRDGTFQRLRLRLQDPPQGGSRTDYRRWALDQPGVTRAWVFPQELGAGTVTVRFCMDLTYSDGIPAGGDVAAVQAALDELRNVTSDLHVMAPIAQPVNFTIDGLTPSDATTKAAIQTALAEVILLEGAPGGTLLWSHLEQAIANAAGEYDHHLASPSADVVSATGYLPVMGTITWT